MKKLTPIIAIFVIGALLAYALYQHQDGLMLTAGIAIIAALGGYIAPHKKPPDNS